MINAQDIFKCLPHRYPFLLVDRVLNMELKVSLQAIKNVTINEQFFTGHFPERPVMPGVLLVEALAQACAILATHSYPDKISGNSLFLLVGIDDTRFKRIVEPGDQLLLDVQMISDKRDILKCKGTASVNGEIACVTSLTSVRREVKPHD